MKIYLLLDPAQPSKFASFSHIGTWSDGSVCKVCSEITSRLVEPLQIQWDDGTEQIGDFSWCGYTAIVLDPVRKFLNKNKFNVVYGKVDVVRPTHNTKRPRVQFPYNGPNLSWLIPKRQILLDEKQSDVHITSDCRACGEVRYNFKQDGVVISKSSWDGEQMFLIKQFMPSAAKFITEDGLAMLNKVGFTNLKPRLAGEIED
jgi:hypothetical protein